MWFRCALSHVEHSPSYKHFMHIEGQVSRAFSVKDLPGYTKLKERQPGQGTAADIAAKDLKAELEEKEVSIIALVQ